MEPVNTINSLSCIVPDASRPLFPIRYSHSTWTRKPLKEYPHNEYEKLMKAFRNSNTSIQANKTIPEIMRIIADGHVCVFGEYRDSHFVKITDRSKWEPLSQTWMAGQAFALDVEPEYVKVDGAEVLKNHSMDIGAFIDLVKIKGIYPAFIYKSFSHQDASGFNRYRPVFFMRELIKDKSIMLMLQDAVFTIYKSACLDSGSLELARVWNPSHILSTPKNEFCGYNPEKIISGDSIYGNVPPKLTLNTVNGILTALENHYYTEDSHNAPRSISAFAYKHNLATIDNKRLRFLMTATPPEEGEYFSTNDQDGEPVYIIRAACSRLNEDHAPTIRKLKRSLTNDQISALSSRCALCKAYFADEYLHYAQRGHMLSFGYDRKGFMAAHENKYPECRSSLLPATYEPGEAYTTAKAPQVEYWW